MNINFYSNTVKKKKPLDLKLQNTLCTCLRECSWGFPVSSNVSLSEDTCYFLPLHVSRPLQLHFRRLHFHPVATVQTVQVEEPQVCTFDIAYHSYKFHEDIPEVEPMNLRYRWNYKPYYWQEPWQTLRRLSLQLVTTSRGATHICSQLPNFAFRLWPYSSTDRRRNHWFLGHIVKNIELPELKSTCRLLHKHPLRTLIYKDISLRPDFPNFKQLDFRIVPPGALSFMG